MIDTDLFQIVTLVLLLLALVVSLVALSGIGRIRKQLQDGGPGVGAGTGTAGEPEPTSASWAEPAAAPAAAQARPEVTAHPLEEAAYGQAAYGQAPGEAAQPAAAQPAASQVAAQPAAQEPQDQPFERDGRWWFRRGDELLVYEESTGQWEPAPGGGGPTSGTAPMPAAGEAVAGAEAGGHWKCPTCGAVNGSTAASCRMCFTPRP